MPERKKKCSNSMRKWKIDRIRSLSRFTTIFANDYHILFNFLVVYIRKCDATAFGYFVFFAHYVFTRFMCVLLWSGLFFFRSFFLSFVRWVVLCTYFMLSTSTNQSMLNIEIFRLLNCISSISFCF